MNVKLDEELQKVKQLDKEVQEHSAVKDVKLLLAGEDQEDARILRGIGANSTFVQIEKERGLQIELENLEKEYDGGVFTLAQIEKLAIKYRLRFLPSALFTDHIDVEVTAKIKSLAKKAAIDLNEHSLNRSFMILAPRESFKLEKFSLADKKRVEQEAAEAARQERLSIERLRRDPLLFYKIDDDKYRLVHKWGNDFSITRRIQGYKWRNANSFWMFNFFMCLPVTALIMAMIFSPMFILGHLFLFTLMQVALTAIFASLAILPVSDNMFFSEHNWKSDQKWVF